MTVVQWQVLEDGAWRDFSESFCLEVEQLWSDWLEMKKGAWRIHDYKVAGEEYVLNFESMTRKHIRSGDERRVRRRLP